MGKEILTFGKIEIKKKKKTLPPKDSYFLGKVDIEKVLVSNKISLVKSTILVTCIMIIKLNH